MGRWGQGGGLPRGSKKGGVSPRHTCTRETPTHTHTGHSPAHLIHTPRGHAAASLSRSVLSLTAASRKPLPATSPCASAAAWALPACTWWGRGPSEHSGRPSLPPPQPPSLRRCPGSSGTGAWPSSCRAEWCPERRCPRAPPPHKLPLSSSGASLHGDPWARVLDSVSPLSRSSELLGLREVNLASQLPGGDLRGVADPVGPLWRTLLESSHTWGGPCVPQPSALRRLQVLGVGVPRSTPQSARNRGGEYRPELHCPSGRPF